ncbi:PREDICTED: coxsackievirus and adenovirus receptor-like, partial [Cyprinodon variegatus]|uniref:coxsackievirus and adenovirus receptor-like n=1 Tax=Cyprinodon variegatus TaxID=28743 RepID=UPI000742AF92
QRNITAEPGQTVILPCKSAEDKPAKAAEWWRSDLESEYLILSRDNWNDEVNKRLSYENRVDLQYRQMKDGDASLVLKNLTTEDTGSYKCKVQNQGSHERKLITTIQLQVSPPGSKDEESKIEGNIVVITVLVIIALVAGVFNL